MGPPRCGPDAANGLVTDCQSLINDGENGFLIEPGDQAGFVAAIRRVLQEDDLRERMQAATITEIQRHDLRNVAQQWEEAYEECVSRRPDRAS